MDNNETKKRGRPRLILTDEEKELRRIKRNKAITEYHKKNGYKSQKESKLKNKAHYTSLNKEYSSSHRITFVVKPEIKSAIKLLCDKTGLSLSELIVTAIEEKYHIVLREK